MTFLNPLFLQIGVGVAVLVVLGHLGHARRLRRLADFLGGRRGAQRLSMSNLYRLRMEQIALLAAAALLLGASAAEPRAGGEVAAGASVSGKSVVLGLDVSASMQSVDVSPTRLAQAVEIARELLGRAEGTRVGLLLFAGKSYALAPPTEDLEALDFLLGGVAPTTSSPQDPGSLLSAGLRGAADLLSTEPGTNERVIVLIGDGEAGEADEDVTAAVREVAAAGVSVHAIGVGTRRGGEMRLGGETNGIEGALLDATGSPGISRLQETLLQSLAQQGGGNYAHADNGLGLRRLYQVMGSPRSRVLPAAAAGGPDLPFLFAGTGLFLLLLHGILEIESRRGRPVSLGRRL